LAGPAAGRGPDIIWEGADILILNKPAGLAVHGHAALNGDTLEDRVRAYLAGKLPPSLSFRPGPLHRLDKPASGIIVFSKTLRGAQLFSGFLREGKLRKRYLALLEGEPEKPALWEEMLVRDGISRRDLPPGGKTRVGSGPGAKQAVTAMTPLSAAKREGITLALLEIATGRTHQIRVQAASHGHPLWGDGKYGAKSRGKGRGGFFLHALSLEFPPPEQAGAAVPVFPRSAAAPLPEAFAETVKAYFDAGALRACEGIMAAPLFSDTIKYD
jgi:23S rRNA pseudouridine955/2504/2580 synthase